MRQPLVPHAPRTLPERPDLDQLRHQARDLLKAAEGGESAASARLEAIGKGHTLAAAQTAIAREHGFASWERLKEAVERRRATSRAAAEEAPDGAPPQASGEPEAPHHVIRQVASLDELARVCAVVGAQITPPMASDDRRFRDLWPRFEQDRSLMWLAEERGEIVGGALAFRPRGSVTVRAIGVAPHARRRGLGRKLMAAVELEATKLGARGINLGASDDAKGFYERLGYAGRGAMMHKGLPLPGRYREARLRQLVEAAAADRPVGGGP